MWCRGTVRMAGGGQNTLHMAPSTPTCLKLPKSTQEASVTVKMLPPAGQIIYVEHIGSKRDTKSRVWKDMDIKRHFLKRHIINLIMTLTKTWDMLSRQNYIKLC